MNSTEYLPAELIQEILLCLSVKDLMRLKCVCKSWNTLLSGFTFIKSHLLRSASRNPRFLLMFDSRTVHGRDSTIVHFPISRLIENPSMKLPDDPRHLLKSDVRKSRFFTIVGSCNGLICLQGYSVKCNSLKEFVRYDWFRLWNPATGLVTGRLGSRSSTAKHIRFSFGYDNSTDTFKVLFFDLGQGDKQICDQPFRVRVFTLGCNLWRDVQDCPLFIFFGSNQKPNNGGVNLSGTLNWLACEKKYHASQIKHYVILSFDLATEVYTQFLLPPDLDEFSTVGALMDCLCLSYVCRRTHFVMWQMTEFGDDNSWTQLMKISYQDLCVNPSNDGFPSLFPLYLYNGDTLLLASGEYEQAILYNIRDNKAQRTRLPDIQWMYGMGYVESLASPFGV